MVRIVENDILKVQTNRFISSLRRICFYSSSSSSTLITLFVGKYYDITIVIKFSLLYLIWKICIVSKFIANLLLQIIRVKLVCNLSFIMLFKRVYTQTLKLTVKTFEVSCLENSHFTFLSIMIQLREKNISRLPVLFVMKGKK